MVDVDLGYNLNKWFITASRNKGQNLSPQSPIFEVEKVASGEQAHLGDVPLLTGILLAALRDRQQEQGAAGAWSQVVTVDHSQARQLTEPSWGAAVLSL